MVVAGQEHKQGLLDEKTERQLWEPLFPSKKSCINGPFQKGIRECWRVLTRNRHVDVRQFFAQNSEGFGHPGQFVVGQEAHDEAWLRWMSDPACSGARRSHLRKDQPGVIEKGSTRRCKFDSSGAARQQLGTDLFFKIPDLPTQR